MQKEFFKVKLVAGMLALVAVSAGHARISTEPVWSPDGKKIAFSSNRDKEHSFQLFIMNADGTNPVRITAKSGL